MNKMNDSGQDYREERELSHASEHKAASERKAIGEPPQTSEIGNTERRSTSKQANKSKSNISKVLQSFVIGGVALVAIGAAAISPEAQPSANIGNIRAFDTYVEYVVDVATTDTEDLKLVIYNDYFKSEQQVLAGEQIGIVEGLTPNKSYTIAISGNFGFGEKTLSKKTFRTLLPENVQRPHLNGIETACSCGEDGKFNFKLKYEDFNNYWSGFSAELVTTGGATVAICEFSLYAAQWQYLDVSGLDKGSYRLIVTAVSSDPKDRETPVKTLYSGIIEI